MKITLIRPPTLLPKSSVTAHQGVPPLGIAYLGGFLRNNGVEVQYVDGFGEKINQFSPSGFDNVLLNGLTIQEIINRISTDTQFIGISCMFSNEWFFYEKLIKEIKKTYPEKIIIAGGEHVSADFEHILKTFPEIDFAISGEGEIKLLNFILKFSQKIPINEIEGIHFHCKQNDKIISNTSIPRIDNIDDIPWPDWNGIPLSSYLDLGLGMAAQGKRSYPTLASRGCPYQCTFCSSPQMWTTKWKTRNIDDIIKELKSAVSLYNINHVEFYDLTAIVNKKWIMNFCEALISSGLKISWSLPSGTRSEALTPDVLKLLSVSGCQKLTYAPESGSIKVLKLIKKKVDLQKMLLSIRSAVQNNITVKINMIFGFPGQTFYDVFLDYVFLLKLAFIGTHDVTCFCFSPYPGSELFNKLLNENKIKRDDSYNRFLSTNVYNSPLNMKSWSEEIPSWTMPILTLGGMAFFYMLQFLFRPIRIYLALKNFILNKPHTMFDLALNGLKNDFLKGRKLKYEN